MKENGIGIQRQNTYVSLQLRVQNRRRKWNFTLNSVLCVNCLSAIQEYSRIIDHSIIWMCIWCGLLQKLHKIKKSEHLNSKVSFNPFPTIYEFILVFPSAANKYICFIFLIRFHQQQIYLLKQLTLLHACA